MRYSEIDLQCEDIMWFGVDKKGHIIAFTSGGCGCVPDYVCRSKEETNQLEEFFMEKLSISSDFRLEVPDNENQLTDDAQLLSKKGIYVYDVSFEDNHADEYSIISSPTSPIVIESLPENIITILQDHVIEKQIAGTKYIKVKHAY